MIPFHRTTSLTIATWNARNIKSQKDEVIQFLQEHSIDILLVQETFLKPSDRFKLPNFRVHRLDRLNGPGGGLAILTKKNLQLSLFPTPQTTQLEAIRGQIQIGQQQYIIASIHKPPNSNLTHEDMDIIFDNDTIPIIAARDYNARYQVWNQGRSNQAGRILFNYTQNHDLLIHNTDEPTYYQDTHPYRSSTIDIAVSKNLTIPITMSTIHKLKLRSSSSHHPNWE